MCYLTAKALWDNIIKMYSDLGNQSKSMNYNSNRVIFVKMVESSRIFKFLARLNVEFDEVRGRILVGNLSSLGEVFAEMHCEESEGILCLGRSSLTMENSALLGIAATASHKPNNQRRLMTSQEFGVIIVINHTTLGKPAGNYMRAN
ncbi:hypothetical protein CK203_107754 [Vitis vinifera]|uniref:Uncharacterized protein n=1 Tax=Vitis vinifera TaxID=29760 RepID=A0A438CFI9_VITVI|nr:hypothetical protein CK203_107754 [Vitis vinifera]